MQNNPQKKNKLFSFRITAFAFLLVLFITFIVLAFQNPLIGNFNDAECLDGATECAVQKSSPYNYVFWVGVYLCSFLGLILMTYKPNGFKKGPTALLSLSAAAAINTLMWMGLVYAAAFLIRLF